MGGPKSNLRWIIRQTLIHSAYSESVSWVAWPIGEASRGPSRNFVCGFCGGTGTNCEACELNFGAAQVIMRNGVCNGTNTSFCHPLSVSVPSCDTKPYYRLLVSIRCIIAEKH